MSHRFLILAAPLLCAAFETLFNSLSDQPKTIANVLFRQLRLA
jgi:hypothetical protein